VRRAAGAPRFQSEPLRASLHSAWLAFKRLSELGFPRRFPIVQFPNLPLIVALLAGEAGSFLEGAGHRYAVAVAYLATAIWAWEELLQGVNWFRHLLGLVVAVVLVVRLAGALHA
jgi:membrane associated rhomboid family serine protease